MICEAPMLMREAAMLLLAAHGHRVTIARGHAGAARPAALEYER